MFIGIKKLKKTEIKYKIKKPTIPCSPIFKFNLRNLSLKIKPYPKIEREKKTSIDDKIKVFIIFI